MIANMWEWASDWDSTGHQADADKACCVRSTPRRAMSAFAASFVRPKRRDDQ
jgi:hypothetical protein